MTAERKNGINELMIACSRGELARAEALVAEGEDVNARDRFGHTALMYAAGAGHAAVVELLLSSGAAAVLRQGRPESPWAALPPADQPFEVGDLSPLIEAPDHHDA